MTADQFRKILAQCGMSQKDAARELDVSVKMIYNYLHGFEIPKPVEIAIRCICEHGAKL